MIRPRRIPLIVLALAAMLVLAACATPGKPETAVETFLTALLAGDEKRVYSAVCPDWEAQAGVELDAFSGVSGRLDGLDCTQAGIDAEDTLVTCQGAMVLDYRGEERSRPLEGRTYLARKIDGEWKMCGYR